MDKPSRQAEWLQAAVLIAAVLAAYGGVWRAGFVWDDDAHVTRPALRTLRGLWRIWFEPGATQQYYPLLHSAFWLEHRLWGDAAAGYHAANVVFHALAACLLLRALRTLAVPGAFLGAALFAVHPVCAESVAWISEQKNTLSAVFYLMAALAYLSFDRTRRPACYAAGTALFALALLSKSVTATLPAALLVVFWWKRGSLSRKADVRPLLPWFVLAAGAGFMTTWMERTHVGASGAAYQMGILDRMLVAGHAIWFYVGKLVWPAGLTFMYPRWSIDPRDPAAYVYPAAAAGALAALWAYRRRSRGPLAAGLLFAGTLFPALGFIDVFPFIYSFVADHFQYLAAGLMLGAAAAALSLATRKLPAAGRWAAAACLVAALGILTRRQCAMYAGAETLWRATIARNPSSWMALNNLASELLDNGHPGEAADEARLSLAKEPRNAEAYVTLGDALSQLGRRAEAFEAYRKALEIEPANAVANNNLGNALLQEGRFDDAIGHYKRALDTKGDFAKARANLADALLRSGRLDEAIAEYGRALDDDPSDAGANANLGIALAEKGRLGDAIARFERAVELDPRFAIAQTNLGNALLQSGRTDEAIAHLERALQVDPNSSAIHNNLGYALLLKGRTGEAIVHFRKALSLDPANAGARRNLDDALTRP